MKTTETKRQAIFKTAKIILNIVLMPFELLKKMEC